MTLTTTLTFMGYEILDGFLFSLYGQKRLKYYEPKWTAS